jgi:ferritin-like metal-binding protein YciE
MGELKDPRELFLHELKDIYYVEKTLTTMLPKLASETTDRELASGFKAHQRETERQVGNLEKVFKKLGRPAQAEQCPGFDGIKQEHDEFLQENPAQQVLNVFLTGAAARTEHYEIAAYTGLIAQARALGEREVVQLLDQNLKQEKETLRKVEKIGRRLTKEATNGGRRASSARRSSSRSSSRAGRTGRARSASRS